MIHHNKDKLLTRNLLLIFLLQQQTNNAKAARCEGTPNLNLSSQICQSFFNETACNSADAVFCLWDSDNACILKPLPSCSLLDDTAEDCTSIDGCYWAEDPVWVWLAIDIPVWLVLAIFCLICYHKRIGPSRLDVFYPRSGDSITAADSMSQFTVEEEGISDVFKIPIAGECPKDSTECEMGSKQLKSVEMKEAAAVTEQNV